MLARTVPARGRAASPRRPPPSLRSGVLALTDTVYPDRGGTDTAEGPAIAAAEGALVLSGSPAIAGKVVRVAFDGGRLTSDAGVLLLAEIEHQLGIAERLARCLTDPRSPERPTPNKTAEQGRVPARGQWGGTLGRPPLLHPAYG